MVPSESPAPPGRRPRGAALRVVPEPSDEDLVVRAQGGDRQAADWLCRRHAPLVTRVVARILGPDAELVDSAQDVLLRCTDDIGSLRDPKAFRSWLVALAVTQAKGVLRRRTRWRWLFGDPPPVEPAAPWDGEAADALRAVYAVLSRLSVDERTLFALRYLEGMELTELATASGSSLATVKRRLAAAHKRFALVAAHEPALEPWIRGSRFDAATAPGDEK